jgi:hypothetical protein
LQADSVESVESRTIETAPAANAKGRFMARKS